MKEQLNKLKSSIASFTDIGDKQHQNFEAFLNNCTVALAAGGSGSRLKNITDELGVHKTALELPNGETMIERTIKMYKKLGVYRIVILVFNESESVIKLLGDGSRYGVNIAYSADPGQAVGRGGAIKNALVNQKIDQTKYLITHNPDDQIVGDQQEIMRNIINQHLYSEELGGIATAVVVEGSPYTFSGLQISDNLVTEIEMYPFIPVPAHIGVTVFSPDVFPYFDRLFDLNKKTDFESVLLPALQRENKLYACRIPTESWIPVNDEKGLNKLIEYLEKN